MWEETEGNPFFVGEVLRHLAETGAVEQPGRPLGDPPVDDLGIPEGVRDVVGRRLSRLSDEANRALAGGAVAGLEFEPAVVRAAAGLGEDELLAALEEAAGRPAGGRGARARRPATASPMPWCGPPSTTSCPPPGG